MRRQRYYLSPAALSPFHPFELFLLLPRFLLLSVRDCLRFECRFVTALYAHVWICPQAVFRERLKTEGGAETNERDA